MTGARAVIAAVVVALGVSACSGGDPEPKFAPPESSAPSDPSTTPASSSTAPTMPPAAQGTDAKAAEAFARFYWDLVNYAQATGETSVLRGFGHKCVTCDRGIDSIDQVYEHGGQIHGGRGSLSDLNANFLVDSANDRVVVEFTLTNSKQFVDYPGTDRDKSYPAGSLAFQLMLESTLDGWRVLLLGER